MNREFALRNFTLQPLFNEVWSLLTGFTAISFEHIFKKRNMVADCLSKDGFELEQGTWEVMEDQAGIHTEYTHASFL